MKTKSTHALTAQAIRKELKQAFPTIKFTVRSDLYAGGNSVRVEWENGPTSEQVMKLISKYQQGHFDGMRDLYEFTNSRDDIPQVKFVFANRTVSEDIQQTLFEYCRNHYNGWDHLTSIDQTCEKLMDKWRYWTARNYIYTLYCKLDLTNGFNIDMIKQ